MQDLAGGSGLKGRVRVLGHVYTYYVTYIYRERESTIIYYVTINSNIYIYINSTLHYIIQYGILYYV